MKTILKKIQIVSLALLVGFGANAFVNGITSKNGIVSKSTTNNQYIFSRYSHNHNSTYPWEDLQSWQSLQSGNTTTDTTDTTVTSLPANTQGSHNWGGYISTPTSGNGYTSVSGSWTVPSISTNNSNAVAAQWIGLGGVNSSDLLQMGTMEDIENGQVTAQVFWEKLPDVARNVITVPVGSTISVNISNSSTSSSTWNLTFTATTLDGQTQTQTVTTTLDSSYAQGIGTSAEWISEDPSDQNNQLVPLANMGTVKYQSAMVNGQPLNASGNNVEPVAMVSNNGTCLIAPSDLGTDGESFTTTNTNTSTNINTNTGINDNSRTRHIPRGSTHNRRSSNWGWGWTWEFDF